MMGHIVCSSVNGLLLLCTQSTNRLGAARFEYVMQPRDLVICNPITREYIKLPSPQTLEKYRFQRDTYGFGVSRISGQYKLVKFAYEYYVYAEVTRPKCEMYTIGTGSWREIDCGNRLKYNDNDLGVFLNGNLCRLIYDKEDRSTRRISCLDLETEHFSMFSPPCDYGNKGCLSLSALRGCLCLCHNSTDDDETGIWLLKEYGDEKSWTKEFVIPKYKHGMQMYYGFVSPIKVFKDGDILMASGSHDKLLHFSNKAKTIQDVDVLGFRPSYCIRAITYTPSFLSLKCFVVENVSLF